MSGRKVCAVVGAGDFFPEIFLTTSYRLLIAADGGYDSLAKIGKKPDITVGDFDSLPVVPNDTPVIKHPVRKDETDMMLSLRVGIENGCDTFLIFGGTGGSGDHTIGNLQLLSFLAKNGYTGFIMEKNGVFTVVRNSALSVYGNAGGRVSVFSLSERSKGVTLAGLDYTLVNGTLDRYFPAGVSNSFTGQKAEISVRLGELLVYWERQPGDKLF